MKRTTYPLWLVLAAGAFALARGDNFLPQPQPLSRYDKMAARSPFTPPSVPLPAPTATPPPPAGPRWWDQLALTSVMQKGTVYFATIVDRASGQRYLLESDKVDDDSRMLLASVEWGEHSDDTTVTLRKDADVTPPLRFDAMAAAAVQPARTAQNMNPGQVLYGPRPQPGTPQPVQPQPGRVQPGSNPNVIRRNTVIQPRAPAVVPGNPALNRPGSNPGGLPGRPVLPGQADDDDDDD